MAKPDPRTTAKISPIAPDFVIELHSPGDDLELLRAKMQEYMDAGV